MNHIYTKYWYWGTDFWIVMDGINASVRAHILKDTPTVGYISELYVDEFYRRKGFGTSLISEAEVVLKINGVSEVNIWCEKALCGYYESQGYTLDKPKDDNDVWMVKIL